MIVGLIGAGNMAGALARGWAADRGRARTSSCSATPTPDRARRWPRRSAAAADGSNRELAERADRDRARDEAGRACAGRGRRARAGRGATRCPSSRSSARRHRRRSRRRSGPGTAVLRFMPNVAAEVRQGPSATRPASALDARTERDLLDLFGLLGELVPVEERLMDAATAISGCGPAFMALVVEALTDAGVEQGLHGRAGRAARRQHDGRLRRAPGGAARRRAVGQAAGDLAGRRHGSRARRARADRRAGGVRRRGRRGGRARPRRPATGRAPMSAFVLARHPVATSQATSTRCSSST